MKDVGSGSGIRNEGMVGRERGCGWEREWGVDGKGNRE